MPWNNKKPSVTNASDGVATASTPAPATDEVESMIDSFLAQQNQQKQQHEAELKRRDQQLAQAQSQITQMQSQHEATQKASNETIAKLQAQLAESEKKAKSNADEANATKQALAQNEKKLAQAQQEAKRAQQECAQAIHERDAAVAQTQEAEERYTRLYTKINNAFGAR